MYGMVGPRKYELSVNKFVIGIVHKFTIFNKINAVKTVFITGCQNTPEFALGDVAQATGLKRAKWGHGIEFKGHVEVGIVYLKCLPGNTHEGSETSNDLNAFNEFRCGESILVGAPR